MAATIFEQTILIKNTEKYPITTELVDKLDEMLNQYNVAHAFVLPSDSQIAEFPEACLALSYEVKDRMTVALAYSLFCKVYRKADDELLAKALVNIAGHYIDAAAHANSKEAE